MAPNATVFIYGKKVLTLIYKKIFFNYQEFANIYQS